MRDICPALLHPTAGPPLLAVKLITAIQTGPYAADISAAAEARGITSLYAGGAQSGSNTGDLNEGSCGEGTDARHAPLPQHDRAEERLSALERI